MKTVCVFLVLFTIGYAFATPKSIEEQLLEAETDYEQRNFRGAVEKFQLLLPHIEKLKDRKKLADIYFKFGRSNRRIGNFPQAHEFLNRAMQLHQQLGDKTGLSFDVTEIAIAHQRQGNYEESSKWANQALVLNQEIENFLGLARTNDTFGNIYYRTGEFGKAIEAFEKALSAAQKSGDREIIGVVYGNLGTVYWSKGDYDAAIDVQQKSHEMAEAIGDLNMKATALGNLAIIHKEQGDIERVTEEIKQIISLYQEAGNRPLEALAHHNLGVAYRDMGDYATALDTLQTALKMSQEIGDKALEASVLNNMGTFEWEIGSDDSAANHMNRSLQLSKEVGESELVSRCLRLLGRIHLNDNVPAALEYYNKAIEMDRESGGKLSLHASLGELGDLYTKRNDLDDALAAYQEALSIGEELQHHADIGFTLTKIANVHRLKRNFKESESMMRRGIALLSESNRPHYEWQAMYYSAMLSKEVGNSEDSIRQLKSSVSILERVRSHIMLPEHKAGYFELKLDVYEELISQLLKTKNDAGAFEYVQKSKTRAFLDLLLESRIDPQANLDPVHFEKKRKLLAKQIRFHQKITEEYEKEKPDHALIRNLEKSRSEAEQEYAALAIEIRKENPRFAELQDPQLLKLAEAQALLDDQTGLLDFFAGQRTSHLFAITRDQVRVFDLPSAEKLNAPIQELLQKIQKPEPVWETTESAHSRYLILARELYKQVLQSSESVWKSKPRLILATDGPLNYLPFELLIASQVQTTNIRFEKLPYLGMKYEFQYVPSISALRAISQTASGTNSRMDFLALADPLEKNGAVSNTGIEKDSTSSLTELPNARLEVEKISVLYPKQRTMLLIGKEASEAKLKTMRLHDFRTIHLASHGLIDEERPQLSSIYLNAGNSNEDGYLTMREIFDLKLDSDLVVLSACKSGLGRNIRGEGFMGLARAFICAGASSVVVSLWNVNDRSTADFMAAFYSARIKQQLSKSSALKQARVQLIQSKTYSHPYYWAPFILIGTR